MVDFDYEAFVDRANEFIIGRAGTVVAVFLVLTVLFGAGLGSITQDSGTDEFSEGIPEQEILDRSNEELIAPFESENATTQLVQTAPNVLAKGELLHMLEAQQRLEQRADFRVASTQSAASVVAVTLDPTATTLDAQIDALEEATPSEVEESVERAAVRNPEFASLVSDDFDRESGSASTTVGLVEHDLLGEYSESDGTNPEDPLTRIQLDAKPIVASAGGDIRVFGAGITADESDRVVPDSLVVVVPAALALILLVLVITYRDPFDLVLALCALGMVIVWTFGFMGWAGIPFNSIMITVPVLLLGVGIDFGIHIVNRYREERITGLGLDESMRVASNQLLVAFFITTGTTVLGFGANVFTGLGPIQDFGLVSAIGILFTFFVFGIFLPAAKVAVDRWREHLGLRGFSQHVIGEGESLMGRGLTVGVVAARRAPYAVLAATLLLSVFGGYYATGVGTSFSNDDFTPPEDVPDYLEALPEPFAPGTYTVQGTTNLFEEEFESGADDTVEVYVEGPLTRDDALESIQRAGENPPETFVTRNGEAQSQSILTVIDAYSTQSPEFAALVARNDVDADGVPDDNVEEIYDALLASPLRGQALQYIAEDYRSTIVIYSVESDASDEAVTADARAVAETHRYEATATGTTVVFRAVAETAVAGAIESLVVSLAGTAIFLVFIYYVLEGRPSLGLVNVVPVFVAVVSIAATMRILGIDFNVVTATLLSITIGLGVAYSVHIVHRFIDEYNARDGDVFAALDPTVRGTGGALTSSMLTTAGGLGVLVLSIFPILGQFGVLVSLSVFYSYLAAVFLTPSVLVAWDRFEIRPPRLGRLLSREDGAVEARSSDD